MLLLFLSPLILAAILSPHLVYIVLHLLSTEGLDSNQCSLPLALTVFYAHSVALNFALAFKAGPNFSPSPSSLLSVALVSGATGSIETISEHRNSDGTSSALSARSEIDNSTTLVEIADVLAERGDLPSDHADLCFALVNNVLYKTSSRLSALRLGLKSISRIEFRIRVLGGATQDSSQESSVAMSSGFPSSSTSTSSIVASLEASALTSVSGPPDIRPFTVSRQAEPIVATSSYYHELEEAKNPHGPTARPVRRQRIAALKAHERISLSAADEDEMDLDEMLPTQARRRALPPDSEDCSRSTKHAKLSRQLSVSLDHLLQQDVIADCALQEDEDHDGVILTTSEAVPCKPTADKVTRRFGAALSLTSRNCLQWQHINLGSPEAQRNLIHRWYKILQDFFFELMVTQHPGICLPDAVDVLREMRVCRHRTDTAWLADIKDGIEANLPKTSGVGCLLLRIADQDPYLQFQEGLRGSYSTYRWWFAFGECLQSWTIVTTSEELEQYHPVFKRKPKPSKVLEWIAQTVPFIGQPETVYIFLNLKNFSHVWKEVVLPNARLQKEDVSLSDGDLTSVFHYLKEVCNDKDHIQEITKNELLRAVMRCTGQFYKELQRLDSNGGPQHCTHCQSLPDDSLERCVRTLKVRQQDVQKFEKTLLIEYDDDCQIPYALGSDQKVPTSRASDLPDLSIVEPRIEVQARCHQDVTRLIDENTENEVGVVNYNPFTCEQLRTIIEHHNSLWQSTGLKRGTSLQKVAYGTMLAEGFCRAQGGRAGDTYTNYPNTKLPTKVTDAVEYMPHMFRTAIDVEIVMRALKHTAPSLYQQIVDAASAAHTFPLGKYGLNAFYTWDYLAMQHRDSDMSWTVSIQTEKVAPSGQYNFAYTQYGIVVRTVANMLWTFFAGDLHGTVAPMRNSINRKGTHSRGIGFVLRSKDAQEATRYHDILSRSEERIHAWST
ncbi:hypothetical protein BDZ89DRAFT_1043581 [Hymenopellis radicata]|nr:hypothetical protein BDZ89DRAFT_1043581 [Hymenopellis radicata]